MRTPFFFSNRLGVIRSFLIWVFLSPLALVVPAQVLEDFPSLGLYQFALQTDGKILGGDYIYNPELGMDYIPPFRLHPDGRLDPSFERPFETYVPSYVVQPDGKIVIGGSVSRLDPDGSLDPTFANQSFYSNLVQMQSDGKLLLFSCEVIRLNTNGVLDPTFSGPAFNGCITTAAIQADGKILVGGWFTRVGGQNRYGLARLNANGTLDTTFNPSLGLEGTSIDCIAVEADRQILVSGTFIKEITQFGEWITWTGVRRVNASGTVVLSFNPLVGGDGFGYVYGMAVQADTKIILAGYFDSLGGKACQNLGRINKDGSFDETFGSPYNGEGLSALALQPDGRILFEYGRFSNTAPPTENLAYDGSVITWMRDGTGPEVWRTTFESSIDHGQTWTNVINGVGLRVTGGWRRTTGGIVPLDANIRARGYYVGANRNASSWFLERIIGPVLITGQPSDREFRSGETGRLHVTAGGTGPIYYQWQKDGEDLTDDGRISGAQSDVLVLGEVTAADAGLYSVVVSNESRTNVSNPAMVTVLDPYFVYQNVFPQYPPFGGTAQFEVQVAGTQPLSYQWYQDGVELEDGGNVSGAHGPSLNLTNVSGLNSGSYWAVVSNVIGSITSVVATLTIPDPVILEQSGDQYLMPGEEAELSVVARGTPPLEFQWYRNGVRINGATNAMLSFESVQTSDSGAYFMSVSNRFGRVDSYPVTLAITKAVPDEFGTQLYLGNIHSMAVQTDGKILLGQSCCQLYRASKDGTLDPSFASQLTGAINALAVQPDGKIVVGGNGLYYSGSQTFVQRQIGRLHANGKLDTTFLWGTTSEYGSVSAIAVQTNGDFIVGGSFDMIGGRVRSNLARIRAAGTLDLAFGPTANGTVNSVLALPSGDIVVGGDFNLINGSSAPYLARLKANGTLDTTFKAHPDGPVYSLLLQPDGSILVGGYFPGVNSPAGYVEAPSMARVFADGSVDPTFLPAPSYEGGNPGAVFSMAMQANGKIVVGGDFSSLAGQPRGYLGRIKAGGTLDPDFQPYLNGTVLSTALQSDGKLLLGGYFNLVHGRYQYGSVRLNNPDTPNEALSLNAGVIKWVRGGASPEISRAFFEYSTNAMDWTSIGDGTWNVNSWGFPGALIPSDAYLRARGQVSGGQNNGSTWLVDSLIGPPLLVSHPSSRTNNAGTVASFFVVGGGTTPLSYQWRKDGAIVQDGFGVSGARTASLTLSNVLGYAAGNYSVVLSNAFGMVTSQVAQLTVIDPILVEVLHDPQDFVAPEGGSFTLIAKPFGSAPFNYFWTRNGELVEGANGPTLTIDNATDADSGEYKVTAVNVFGSAEAPPSVVSVTRAYPDDFAPEISDIYYSQTSVLTIAVQPDERVLVGGYFSQLSDVPRNALARLMEDGSLDETFDAQFNDYATILSLALQPDGKILVGGYFETVRGKSHRGLVRLEPDGSLDSSFVFSLTQYAEIHAIVLLADGKILIGGNFTVVGGAARKGIARLWPDGSLDTSFDAGAIQEYNFPVQAIAVQPDGSILMAGSFSSVAGQARRNLVRLTADGALDPTFTPQVGEFYEEVRTLALQPDGKIVVGGTFYQVNGVAQSGLARLNSDGTLDVGFHFEKDITSYGYPGFGALSLQTDGKIVFGGVYYNTNGIGNTAGRLETNGFLDPTFDVGLPYQGYLDSVWSAVVQPDGRVLLGGNFQNISGQPRNGLARLGATDPAGDELLREGEGLLWKRTGAGPEFSRTFFESSSDGLTWSPLGEGTRVVEGWQYNAMPVPAGMEVRARGFVNHGGHAEWFVETSSMPTVALRILPESLHSSAFGFLLSAPPGQTVVIEGTEDFLNWTPLQTNEVSAEGLIEFTDPEAASRPYRFYRGRIP